MATILKTEIPTDLIFTSAIDEIVWATDATRLAIKLKADDVTLYSTTLYPYDGIVTMYDVRGIIEAHLASKRESFCVFTLLYGDPDGDDSGAVSLYAIYCNQIMPVDAPNFVTYNYLTTSRGRRTYPHSTELLPFSHGVTEYTIKAHCVFDTSDGSVATATVDLFDLSFDDNGVYTMVIKYDDIVTALERDRYAVERLLAYTIICGNRHLTYYVYDAIPAVEFCYRNSFNALESFALYGVSTAKTKVDRQTATLSASNSFYDQTTAKDFELQTGPLTADEVGRLEQLIMSGEVYLGVSADTSALPEILITESTCEISDSDADPARAKITWQHKETTPHCKEVSEETPGTFGDEYDYQFD